ncbi:MAG: hypothetical protein K2K31_03085 [Clostridia bacterium]|nr:hypothetical protein [Clostridia bacterium]
MKNFFKKFKSYNFWISFSGVLIIALNAFGKIFGFSIENQGIEECVLSVAGVLVVLGIVVKDDSNRSDETEGDKLEEKDEKSKNSENQDNE